jgi:hypothetical protein
MAVSKDMLLEAAKHGRDDIKKRIEETVSKINALEDDLKFFKLKLNDYTTVIDEFSNDKEIRHDD